MESLVRMAKKDSAASTAAKGWRRILPSSAALERAGRVGLAIFVILLVAFGVQGTLRVRDQVSNDEKFFIDGWDVEFLGTLPGWVTPEIADELHRIPPLPSGDASLFRRGVLRDLRTAIESSPWIERVVDLRLAFPTSRRPGQIRFSFVLRQPVAMVESQGRLYLSDGAGRRLGNSYADGSSWATSPASWFRIPVIRGSRGTGAVPEAGQIWQDPDILEGVSVARVLVERGIHTEFPHWPIDTIDISNVSGRVRPSESDIVLYCDGRRLEWGRSPISTRSRTIPIAEVVENLRQVLRSFHETDFSVTRLYHRTIVGSNG
jgi:hypothetical protein